MKKAVLYARVSSDLQKKEKTIDSQILELKKQITKAGDVLVKEYVDDGYSGARLDRPAMDELRRDLKTKLFETVYFLNADRIARDVTYQNIIVAEILKHGKQLIINGKDYVQNSENKFTLTVLGAVSELERAKIGERVARGKALKLAQGCHPGRGCNLYGYDFVHKAPDTVSASFTINEKEAEGVRLIFNEYAKGGVSTHGLTHVMKVHGYLTKTGQTQWHDSVIKGMLKNHAYTGKMYMNKMKLIREYSNPLQGITKTTARFVPRDKSDWVGILVPPIISQELFDKVQVRLEWNEKNFRNPPRTQILSNLIVCNTCGSKYASFKHETKKLRKRDGVLKVWKNTGYICNGRQRRSDRPFAVICHTKQIIDYLVEDKLWDVVETTMTNPEALRSKIPTLQGKTQNAQLRLKRRIAKIEQEISSLTEKRKRIINLYTNGDIGMEDYNKNILECDQGIAIRNTEKKEVLSNIPVLYKENIVAESIEDYCAIVRKRYEECTDFDTKRKFCLDFVDKIVHDENDGLTFHGSVPIEGSKLGFVIKKVITKSDRFNKRPS